MRGGSRCPEPAHTGPCHQMMTVEMLRPERDTKGARSLTKLRTEPSPDQELRGGENMMNTPVRGESERGGKTRRKESMRFTDQSSSRSREMPPETLSTWCRGLVKTQRRKEDPKGIRRRKSTQRQATLPPETLKGESAPAGEKG